MKEFKFKAQKVEELILKIDGKEYTFNPLTYNTKKAMEKYVIMNQTLVNKSKKPNNSKEDLDKIIMDACDLARETVNKILGAKAYDKIFNNRTVIFEEQQELLSYIFESITEFSRKIEHEYTAN